MRLRAEREGGGPFNEMQTQSLTKFTFEAHTVCFLFPAVTLCFLGHRTRGRRRETVVRPEQNRVFCPLCRTAAAFLLFLEGTRNQYYSSDSFSRPSLALTSASNIPFGFLSTRSCIDLLSAASRPRLAPQRSQNAVHRTNATGRMKRNRAPIPS